ncbi:rhomboid-related protein 4 [Pontoporia blainvillei]|uniref:Rhomboid-related protein 4 n=1 Tax=Pontoporia blainvillei TaxID=48723 RepID=A0ABX0S0V1_PONBL|nr:rhomboid-related protein 4 [Pontoporia blainvillei]
MQRRSRGVNIGLLLLLSQILHVGINNIPPVTLATLALNIWLFLNPLKPLLSSCLSVEKCYEQKDWQRLLLSPLHHADDWHLYFNMVSMLWKGIHLERRLGSRWFAYVIITFSLLTGVMYLLLEFALAEFMDEPDFRRNCAVGFSGVLFALKVLNNHYCPGGFVNVLGFPVPNKFACWAELLAIHFISPGKKSELCYFPTSSTSRTSLNLCNAPGSPWFAHLFLLRGPGRCLEKGEIQEDSERTLSIPCHSQLPDLLDVTPFSVETRDSCV